MTILKSASLALGFALAIPLVPNTAAVADDGAKIRVTAKNFTRAETDTYFKKYKLGKLTHSRTMANINKQNVVRMNRDTLYSIGIYDLDAGPVTVTLPDSKDRFTSMQVISEDHYTIDVVYAPGRFTYTRDKIGTRYVALLMRVLADPSNLSDLRSAHEVQNSIEVEQKNTGKFEIPSWDEDSLTKMRDNLSKLATKLMSLQDKMGPLAALRHKEPPVMFGTKEEVDPLPHLIGTAIGWGGNPPSEAVYEGFVPTKNDCKTVHKLILKDVPVDGFWSVSVYNEEGFFEKNDLNAYSLNDLIAKKGPEGAVTVQFGGCNKETANCLPITGGWNYTVRLYRPRQEILDGSWKLPEAQPVE